MATYTVIVELWHTWHSTEEIEIKVTADNEANAIVKAQREAYNESDPDHWDVDLDSSVVNGAEIVSCEPDKEPITPRCNATIDMFSAKAS